MSFLKEIYFLNLGFGNKYGSDEKILQRLLVIDILLFLGSFLYVVYDFVYDFLIKGGYGIEDLPVFLLFLCSTICLVLYRYKFFLAGKFLTAFLPQIFIFGCAYFGVRLGEYFFWLPLVLLGISVFPVLIFDQKNEKKWLIFAVIFNLIYLLFYDRILLHEADPQYINSYAVLSNNAVFYKSVQVVLYIFLISLLYYVIRVNNHHQLICERVNSSLSRERDRLDFLNAEIQAQRNAINKAASLLVTDENGNIKSANRNFCRITGYSIKELIGKNPRILNSGYHDDAFFENLWKTIKSGNIWSGEMKNKRKDDSFYWLDTTIAPLYDREKKQTGFLAIRFDCTKRKLYEEEFLKLNEEKENILYAIAHDLKNPMTNLLAMIQLMKSNALNEKQKRESYELIINDCSYSLKLINQILEAGKLENLKNGLKKESVSLNELIQKSLDQFDSIIGEKRLKINRNLSDFAQLVYVDVDKFESAMKNIIYNAIKFNPIGGEILVETSKKGDNKTEIKISDTGIGISDQQLPYIFDKFSKASRLGTCGEKSNGIGLWIVKRIVELHEGEISILSKVNVGTQVKVIIP